MVENYFPNGKAATTLEPQDFADVPEEVSKILTTTNTNTTDGRNPAPIDMENIPSFTRFYICQVVVWDF